MPTNMLKEGFIAERNTARFSHMFPNSLESEAGGDRRNNVSAHSKECGLVFLATEPLYMAVL